MANNFIQHLASNLMEFDLAAEREGLERFADEKLPLGDRRQRLCVFYTLWALLINTG